MNMNDELMHKLELLADGELNRDEYASLLASLDQHDEGWKHCALALLESQALRTELRGVKDESAVALNPALVRPAAPKSPAAMLRSHWAQALALAGCLALTFWLGRGSISTGEPRIAVTEPPRPTPPEAASYQGRVRLVLNDQNGRPHEVDLPVVDGNDVDARQALAQSTAIPPDVLQAIEQSGHTIERHREFVRQNVDSSHEVVVPVDRVRVVPVSYPSAKY
jgi:hypothetical protein